MTDLLVYGATGFTAQMIVSRLREQAPGLSIVLAGRNADALARAARSLDLPWRAFELAEPRVLAQHIGDARVLLNCAGPFAFTSARLVDACLLRGSHYLDIAGEVAEFEVVAARDEAARSVGLMLLPGVGFGVVPTDCAAALAAERVGKVRSLVIAYDTVGGASRGTLRSLLPRIHEAGVRRMAGRFVASAPGTLRRRVQFGDGARWTVNNPWRADLFSAAWSTGALDVDTFATFPAPARAMMRMPWVMSAAPVQRALGWILQRAPAGPDERARAQGYTRVRAEAVDETGRTAVVVLRGPEAYVVTARAAAAAVLASLVRPRPGYQTPATAFGSRFIEHVEGLALC